jgi:hypothetical protein
MMPQEQPLLEELHRLHETRSALEDRIRLAQARGRYGGEGEADEGRADEAAAVAELDRVLTRIRAVEGKLALARRGLRPRYG